MLILRPFLINMEVFSSEQYRKKAQAAEECLKTGKDRLPEQTRLQLEIIKHRGETHRKIEAATAGSCNIFSAQESGYSKIAGYNDGSSHLKEETLDDYTWALHVKRHEDLHSSALTKIDTQKYLPKANQKALAEELGINHLSDIDWVEGFTELANITSHGKNRKCAYLKKEVPAAMELDLLCKKHLRESLLPSFKFKNAALFYYLLRQLSDKLIHSHE